MPRTCFLFTLPLLMLNISCLDAAFLQAEENTLKLKGAVKILRENFSGESGLEWKKTDDAAWEMQNQEGNQVLCLIKKKSDYEPPVRSPYNRAILQDHKFGSVVLDVKLKSTSPDYGHRSLCLFFGYQDESHFYYVHFGKETDDHANQIFIVNGEPRTKISVTTTDGTPWDDQWHHARIIRNAESGLIEVYFDDMTKPVMTAQDQTFPSGTVGIGSFDDPGNFDEIEITGRIE